MLHRRRLAKEYRQLFALGSKHVYLRVSRANGKLCASNCLGRNSL